MTGTPTRSPPDLDLVDGGGAERIGGGEHHLVAVFSKSRGEFSDGGGLARSIDPGNDNDTKAPVVM